MINCVCPECDEELEVGDKKLGKTVTCPECGEDFKVVEKEKPKERKKNGKRRAGSSQFSSTQLREIALYQRVLLFCILANIGAGVAYALAPTDAQIFALAFAGVVAIGSCVCMFLLATKLYGAAGIFLALLTFLPIIGLLVLVIVNQKATSTIQSHEYSVGFLGAPLGQFDRYDDDDDEE